MKMTHNGNDGRMAETLHRIADTAATAVIIDGGEAPATDLASLANRSRGKAGEMIVDHTASSVTMTELDYDRLAALAEGGRARTTEGGRILARELARAGIVKSREISPDVVTMNTRAVIREVETGATRTFTLVYPGDADISTGKLSVLTPAGATLIGLSRGATLEWLNRDGERREMLVLDILYQPEADGRDDM